MFQGAFEAENIAQDKIYDRNFTLHIASRELDDKKCYA